MMNQCTAHRKNGDRCKRPAIRGATVCRTHGGAAPQVRAKARRRLEEAADRMAKQLLHMATDQTVSDAVKLAAIRDALDRAGLKPTTAVEVGLGTQPWQELVEGVVTLTRAESRAQRGLPPGAAPATATDPIPVPADGGDVVDAELVPLVDPDVMSPSVARDEMRTAGQGYGHPDRDEPPATPGTGLMTLEEANTIARQRYSG